MASLSNAPAIAPFETSETKATSVYAGPFGQVFYDPSNPMDAYMLVDCQSAFVIGEVVVIDKDGLATQITSTSVGLVGVIVATVSGSDTAAYAQIEGEATAIVTSGVDAGQFLFAPATTDGGYLDFFTSTILGNKVEGAVALTSASTASTYFTSDTSASGLVGAATLHLRRGGAFVYGIQHGPVLTT